MLDDLARWLAQQTQFTHSALGAFPVVLIVGTPLLIAMRAAWLAKRPGPETSRFATASETGRALAAVLIAVVLVLAGVLAAVLLALALRRAEQRFGAQVGDGTVRRYWIVAAVGVGVVAVEIWYGVRAIKIERAPRV